MTLCISAAQLSHETNVFSAVRTDMAAFAASTIRRGNRILDEERDANSSFGGFIAGAERLGFELIPILSVWATPSGMVDGPTLRSLIDELIAGIETAGPIDGILLGLHGAMVSELDRDGDALILESVRETIGNEIPLVATIDLHANISPRMVDAATMLIGYDTYPHVDMAVRAEEACRRIVQSANGEITPAAALVKPPMLPTSQRMTTDRSPMRDLIALAHEWEAIPGVLCVTVAGGFPPADVEEAGFSVLVYSEGDVLWRSKPPKQSQISLGSYESNFAVVSQHSKKQRSPSRPIAPETNRSFSSISVTTPGPADPATASSSCDFSSSSRSRTRPSRWCPIPFAQPAVGAGPGATVHLRLGGKTDSLHGEPIDVDAHVRLLSDGHYVNDGPMMAGVQVDLGPSAVVLIDGIEVLVTSRAETPIDLNVFRAFGIDPTQRDVIALKGKGHFRAAFEPIASRVILVEGPGITGADLSRLPFQHLQRPIWPLDLHAEW